MPAPSQVTDSPTHERVLTVTQLTAQLKGVVESKFSEVWVAGEISNFSRPQSGHCYFTLKDDAAQLRGVIWRGTASRLKFNLENCARNSARRDCSTRSGNSGCRLFRAGSEW